MRDRVNHGGKQPSAAKSGPGRYHVQGHSKASPRRVRGVGAAMPASNPERAFKARIRKMCGSARQMRRFLKQTRRQARESAA